MTYSRCKELLQDELNTLPVLALYTNGDWPGQLKQVIMKPNNICMTPTNVYAYFKNVCLEVSVVGEVFHNMKLMKNNGKTNWWYHSLYIKIQTEIHT